MRDYNYIFLLLLKTSTFKDEKNSYSYSNSIIYAEYNGATG